MRPNAARALAALLALASTVGAVTVPRLLVGRPERRPGVAVSAPAPGSTPVIRVPGAAPLQGSPPRSRRLPPATGSPSSDLGTLAKLQHEPTASLATNRLGPLPTVPARLRGRSSRTAGADTDAPAPAPTARRRRRRAGPKRPAAPKPRPAPPPLPVPAPAPARRPRRRRPDTASPGCTGPHARSTAAARADGDPDTRAREPRRRRRTDPVESQPIPAPAPAPDPRGLPEQRPGSRKGREEERQRRAEGREEGTRRTRQGQGRRSQGRLGWRPCPGCARPTRSASPSRHSSSGAGCRPSSASRCCRRPALTGPSSLQPCSPAAADRARDEPGAKRPSGASLAEHALSGAQLVSNASRTIRSCSSRCAVG